jgi:hypothetical protein
MIGFGTCAGMIPSVRPPASVYAGMTPLERIGADLRPARADTQVRPYASK